VLGHATLVGDAGAQQVDREVLEVVVAPPVRDAPNRRTVLAAPGRRAAAPTMKFGTSSSGP
jgi:hypothetical protein